MYLLEILCINFIDFDRYLKFHIVYYMRAFDYRSQQILKNSFAQAFFQS